MTLPCPRFQASRNTGFSVIVSERALKVEKAIFVSFAHRGTRPKRIFSGTRLPSADRIAVRSVPVGGMFQDGAMFGGDDAGSNFSLILISE